jgi:hypothetical protein
VEALAAPGQGVEAGLGWGVASYAFSVDVVVCVVLLFDTIVSRTRCDGG